MRLKGVFFAILQGMKIGIDARMYGPKVGGGGLGRYVEQLIIQLQKIDQENRYILFLKPENFEDCVITNPHFEKRCVPIHWYSLKEQLFLAKMIDREGLDLLHFPHWNVPWNIKTPFVVTIHDLILLEQPRSAKITTRHPLTYLTKYIGYRFVLSQALKRSRKIIAVSQYTKKSILKHFSWVREEKIEVIYEGITPLPALPNPSDLSKLPIPYLLYIGNAYPHKNLKTLLHAFLLLQKKHPNLHLIVAGRKDIFSDRLLDSASHLPLPQGSFTFIPNPTDSQLSQLYAHATVYVFPSLIEGFGLPPLEAMQQGVPVAASNTSCLPEILGNAAVYFPPTDLQAMIAAIESLLQNDENRFELIGRGYARASLYSWSAMAQTIKKGYAKWFSKTM